MSGVPTLDPLAAYALWADSYPAQAHNPVMQAEQRAMLALLPSSLRGQHVLDAGCGSGRYLLHALQRGAGHVTGVDLSPQMLTRAAQELGDVDTGRYTLHEGRLEALPLADASVDLSLCALALGHLPQLPPALAELRRVTRPGGWVLCSDVHPIGPALGWRRDFKAGGRRYAVRHTQHLYSHWHAACAALGLAIDAVSEPMLDPADIPASAHFDPAALQVPVALVLRLRRLP
ncbi:MULTISPECIES: class I SAM-dependent methyltransferase [unclassified Xanthomonas]|uniref:class I SAM-dependent methyltransferase n=1 Tax=unclassified Xanthomonas TaxID=2643310 RepID=UPI002A811A12|nr:MULTISPECIES: class I SAM-dependent methyltransferase [unclassified Xanthomonas]MDY4298074.1 class I SAM-dependent methyltransferase [Xanthomonas sp. LF02-5]MDY4359859.1 class I SAM-dependent methyltransferase [Xanthomonas sp. LF04-12]